MGHDDHVMPPDAPRPPPEPPGPAPTYHLPTYYPPTGYTVAGPPPYGQPYGPGPVSPAGYRLADFGDRFVAFCLDSLILGAVALVLSVPVFVVFAIQLQREFPNPKVDPPVIDASVVLWVFGLLSVMLLILIVLRYIYQVEMVLRTGQTVGKRVAKIRIIPLDPGLTLTRGMLAKRFLVETVVGSIVPFFAYLDGFWQLWDQPYRQCLHDKAAATVVVKLIP